MNKRFNIFLTTLKKNLGLFVSISLGVFLFVLFFQPFSLELFDFNNRLLFIAGFGAMVFIFLIFRMILSHDSWENHEDYYEPVFSSYLADFIIIALISVAFPFYLRYVGHVRITFFIVFKGFLISLAPVVVYRLSESFRVLRYQDESLKTNQIRLQQLLEKYEENNLTKTIEILSENRNENLKLQIADIVFLRSADNYVEIFYRVGEGLKKDLIRNTLKNIEQQIKAYHRFVRCHRTCIVNSHYVDKLNKTMGNYWLSLINMEEKIPVSRPYLLIVKEMI